MVRTYVSKFIHGADISAADELRQEIDANTHLVHSLVKRDMFDANTSWHVHYKYANHLTDYLVTSIEASAKGIRKNAQENLQNHIEELESQIRQIDKKIKTTQKQLDNMLSVKRMLIKRTQAVQAGHAIPQFKAYAGSGISEKHDVFTVKLGKRAPLFFDNAYLFELQYVDPYIAARKRRILQFNDRKRRKENKLAALQKKRDAGDLSICFGGKKLFGKQYTMPHIRHEDWHNAFVRQRRRGMMLVGRSDATQGNFMCKYNISTHTLEIATGLTRDAFGNLVTIAIPGVVFPYGQDFVEMAVCASETYKLNKKLDPEHQVACFPKKPVTWTIYRRSNDFLLHFRIRNIASRPSLTVVWPSTRTMTTSHSRSWTGTVTCSTQK